jgi:hypothetical protein
MLKLKSPKLEVAPAEEEENLEPIPSHPTWSGSISIGPKPIPSRPGNADLQPPGLLGYDFQQAAQLPSARPNTAEDQRQSCNCGAR